jgi:hypothetical protein
MRSSFANALGSRGLRAAPLVALLATLALAYAVLGRLALDDFPYSGDEYSYLLQAHIFAGGRLSVPAPAHPEIFQLDHVLLEPVVRSKYPPGWPALLALGAALHAPWIVNPLLGAATLAIVYALIRRLYGGGAALATTLLVGCSPFFALNAASYHSHTSSLFALVAFVACFAAGWQRRALGWAALAGAALGLAFLNRQLDAVIYGAGLALFVRRAPRYVAACAVPAAAVASLLLLYQAAQFGSPWTTGYALYEPMLLKLYGDTNAYPFTVGHLLDGAGQWCHVQWLGQLTAWMVPGTAVLGAVGLALRQEAGTARDVVRRWMILVAGLQLVVMLFYGHDSGPSYGPRYLFPLLGPIVFGLGAAWEPLWRWVTRDNAATEHRTALAFLAVLGAGLLRVGFLVDEHRDTLRHSTQLYAMVERAQLRGAVVIVKGPFPERFTRNGTRFDGPVLFVAPRDDDATIASFFPDRAVYVTTQPWERADWTLQRLAP